ncbi:MAG: fused MFS/spermidine synthase [Planctomycetia bacterium]|nr:fused MFS/spermidine synthase [Planctomycetia bacterium]
MFRFAVTIFLSAFLLFQVQPLIGKYILPWFGGSPGVWTTCMLMFQMLLLAGYGYAHFATTRMKPRTQGIVHLILLLASLVMLPIVPDDSWKPSGEESPSWRILLLLVNTIGIPYFLLSTTGPLLQSWFAREYPNRSPFRLYALSNFGSLLALLSYPLLVEPSLKLGTQAAVWSMLYSAFTLVCGWNAVKLIRFSKTEAPLSSSAATTLVRAQAGAPAAVSSGTKLLWILLACTASVMLLATTNQICQQVAVTPFLWIVPLAIYLISFILTFDAPRWYRRDVFGPLLALSTCAAWYVVDNSPMFRHDTQLVVYGLALFAVCMTCHGELVRAKPHPSHLTLFYLLISVGGALGGLLTALVAPRLFSGYVEYQLGLAAACVLLLVCLERDARSPLYRLKPFWVWCSLGCACMALCAALGKQAFAADATEITAARNFYGVLKIVNRESDAVGPQVAMVHGRIVHGVQFTNEALRRMPTSYYGPDSGFAVAASLHPRRASAEADRRNLRIGVVGLGAGVISAYGQAGDSIRYYEINPDVIRMAQQYFSFLRDSRASNEIVLGDARVCLERELISGSQKFDILVIDAFSGDAVPMHLLTRECFRTYDAHLAEGGMIVMNISNDNVDLAPVVRAHAAELQLQIRSLGSAEDRSKSMQRSDWLILTRNTQFLNDPQATAHFRPIPSKLDPILWTDDFGSLRQVLLH